MAFSSIPATDEGLPSVSNGHRQQLPAPKKGFPTFKFVDAGRRQRANRLRELITTVEDRTLQNGDLTPEKQQWIEWVNAKADWIDPLIRRADPILDAPEPEASDFWKF